MSFEVHPARLRGAANAIRADVATSDMRHRFAAYRVGEIDGWRSLFAFKTAASAFAGIMSEQLGVIANSFTLGANDSSDADLVAVEV